MRKRESLLELKRHPWSISKWNSNYKYEIQNTNIDEELGVIAGAKENNCQDYKIQMWCKNIIYNSIYK